MKADLRLGVGVLATALALAPIAAPTAASAQESNQATTNAPAPNRTGTVGPQELQNFDLQKSSRSADQAPTLRPSSPPALTQPPSTQNVVQSVAGAPASERTAAPARRVTAEAEASRAGSAPEHSATAERAAAPEPLHQTPPASSVTVSLPPLDNGAASRSAAAPVPIATAGVDSPATVAPDQKLSILPWLLAAFALGAGAAFFFLRHRSREAFAGGPQIDAFVAPEPSPAPAPGPVPASAPGPTSAPTTGTVSTRKRSDPSIPGVVSTRLRPWIDIGFAPAACLVEEHQVTFEFAVELFNTGSTAARSVLIEASMFNASNSQDQELEAFFANPLAEGERISSIPPLKRVRFGTKVVTERDHMRIYEIGGRKVFVPIIAFNVIYRWSAGEGQTSSSFLLGVDTKGEKMAPIRVDLGRRLFTSVAARDLPTGVRR